MTLLEQADDLRRDRPVYRNKSGSLILIASRRPIPSLLRSTRRPHLWRVVRHERTLVAAPNPDLGGHRRSLTSEIRYAPDSGLTSKLGSGLRHIPWTPKATRWSWAREGSAEIWAKPAAWEIWDDRLDTGPVINAETRVVLS